MNEIYISTDVETDGPIPGPHSMLSLGSAAYTADKILVSTFSANLETLPGARAHPKTAEWWAKQPEAWAASRKDLESPEQAMTRYVTFVLLRDAAIYLSMSLQPRSASTHHGNSHRPSWRRVRPD